MSTSILGIRKEKVLKRVFLDIKSGIYRFKKQYLRSGVVKAIRAILLVCVIIFIFYQCVLSLIQAVIDSNNRQTHGHIFYLSAKFGFNDKFESEVRNQRKRILKQTSIPSENVFTYFHLPEHISNDPKWARYTQFLRNETDVSWRGAGYWFWKSVLISEHLEAIKENNILVYSDTDHVINGSRMERLINAMDEKKKDFVIQQLGHKRKESLWTKADIYEHFYHGKVNQTTDTTAQYQAGGLQIIRKTDWTSQLINDWMKEMENWHLVSDEPSIIPNYPDWKDNRHDQSMLSMLLKTKYHHKEAAKVNATYLNTTKIVTYLM